MNNNLPYVKIIATVSQALAKETILSKLINFVHVFRVDLSEKSFDDSQKKYIDTILKLDNSKTIMLETKGEEVIVKNMHNISYAQSQDITIEFSEYKEDEQDILFINYAHLHDVSAWSQIRFVGSDVVIDVVRADDEKVYGRVSTPGVVGYGHKIQFENYKPILSFLSEKDKKDVIRWLQSGVNMIAASAVKSGHDIQDLQQFLEQNNGQGVKVVARIHTKAAFENIDDIVTHADGIIFGHDDTGMLSDWSMIDAMGMVELCKKAGKPFILSMTKEVFFAHEKALHDFVVPYEQLWVDSFMLSADVVNEEEPLHAVFTLHESINKIEDFAPLSDRLHYSVDDEMEVSNYIIKNAYNVTKELPIKAIVCYTDNGYTPARLASLRSDIPVIAFTRSDPVYRYINMLRWVKWYKISQNFDYQHLKRIGKEMIRIIFKWNISLDDKILIVQANESNNIEKTDMINGIELYKFKDI